MKINGVRPVWGSHTEEYEIKWKLLWRLKRRNEMASEGEMYRVIKLLLYIFLNSTCSPQSGWRLRFWSKTSMQVAILPSGEIQAIHFSRLGAAAIFLKTRNYFSNKLSETLRKFHFDDVPAHAHAAIERYVPLNWNGGMTHKPIAFQWAQTGLKRPDEQLYLTIKHTVSSELTMMCATWNWLAIPVIQARFHLAFVGEIYNKNMTNYLKSSNWFVFSKSWSQ